LATGCGATHENFHWTGETHKFGVPAALYACVSPHQGRSVVITPVPAGVTVTPAKQPVDPDGSGVEKFAVVVQPGVAGRVWLQQLDNGVGSASLGGGRACLAMPAAHAITRRSTARSGALNCKSTASTSAFAPPTVRS
jgi:hypothetical protein